MRVSLSVSTTRPWADHPGWLCVLPWLHAVLPRQRIEAGHLGPLCSPSYRRLGWRRDWECQHPGPVCSHHTSAMETFSLFIDQLEDNPFTPACPHHFKPSVQCKGRHRRNLNREKVDKEARCQQILDQALTISSGNFSGRPISSGVKTSPNSSKICSSPWPSSLQPNTACSAI